MCCHYLKRYHKPKIVFYFYVILFEFFITVFFQNKSINIYFIFFDSEAATRGVLSKKVFLEISENSQENTRARVSLFNKVAALRPATLLKKRLWHRCFPVNFTIFLRTPFLQNTSGGLLLVQLIFFLSHHCMSCYMFAESILHYKQSRTYVLS